MFDPYQTWLQIPAEQQPPDYYRLLGIRRFEKDQGVIEAAAEERLAALRPHEAGADAEACRKLMGEIRTAKVCLLNDSRRTAYDLGLLQKMAAAEASSPEKSSQPPQATAGEFLDVLEARDLVPETLLASLREQVALAKVPIAAGNVAKLLIDKGLLTPVLARRLLAAEAKESRKGDPAPPRPRSTPHSDLDLAPLESEPGQQPGQRFLPPPPPAKTLPPDPRQPPEPPREERLKPLEAAPQGSASLLEEELLAAAGSPGAATELTSHASRKRGGLLKSMMREMWQAWRTLWSSPLTWIAVGLLVLLAISVALIVAARQFMPG